MSDTDTFDDIDNDGRGVHVAGSIMAKLSAGIDGLARVTARHAEQMERANRLAEQAAELMPISAVRNGNFGAVPASGLAVVDLGGPAVGRVWELRRIVVGRAVPSSAAVGTAYVYGTAMPPYTVPANLSMSDAIDWFTAMPAKGNYGAGDVTLLGGDRLFVVIVGATVGAIDYAASARIVDRLVTPTERSSLGV